MNHQMISALTRLRAADPAAGRPAADPREPLATAMLDRILAEPDGVVVHRRLPRRVVIGATAAAGTAAAAALVAGLGERAGPPASTGRNMLDAAYITTQTQAALASVNDYVIGMQTRGHTQDGDGSQTFWKDQRSGQERLDTYRGARLSSIGFIYGFTGPISGSTTHRAASALRMDYQNRTWWEHSINVPWFEHSTSVLDPAWMRKELAMRTWTVVGRETLDGHHTVHLRSSSRTTSGLPETTVTEYWVDMRTYQLVRAVVSWQMGSDQRVHRVPTDFTWLPRTPKNLAMFDPKVPAGFRRVAAPVPPFPLIVDLFN